MSLTPWISKYKRLGTMQYLYLITRWNDITLKRGIFSSFTDFLTSLKWLCFRLCEKWMHLHCDTILRKHAYTSRSVKLHKLLMHHINLPMGEHTLPRDSRLPKAADGVCWTHRVWRCKIFPAQEGQPRFFGGEDWDSTKPQQSRAV